MPPDQVRVSQSSICRAMCLSGVGLSDAVLQQAATLALFANFLTALEWAAMVQIPEHFNKNECAFT
jgi:hypothetical protein